MRDTDLALELARRAVELTGRKDIVSLELLAAACAQAGQFDKAVDSEQAALELASAAKDDAITRRITEQLKVYRQKTTAPNDLKSP
jgi:Flp pilus assembly protein TadD